MKRNNLETVFTDGWELVSVTPFDLKEVGVGQFVALWNGYLDLYFPKMPSFLIMPSVNEVKKGYSNGDVRPSVTTNCER